MLKQLAKTKSLLHSKLLAFATVVQKIVSSRAFLVAVLVWFGIQTVYMALSTKLGIPPDEKYHLRLMELFVQNGWSPFIHDQTGYYSLGEVTHTPFILYHYLLSLPMHLFGNFVYDFMILRFVNIGLAFWSFYLIIKIANLIGMSKLVRNLGLFMLANTLMFVFLSASISYDNLFIPLGLLVMYLLLRLLDKATIPHLLLFLTAIMAGMLVKISFLPIALGCVVVLGVLRYKELLKTPKQLLAFCKSEPKLAILLLAPLLIMLLFTAQKFAYNLATYRDITPECNVVNTEQQCRQNAIYMRNMDLRESHPPVPQLSPFEYTASWISLMKERTFGIFAHRNANSTALIDIWAYVLIVLIPLVVIRKYKTSDRNIAIILGLMLFYGLMLILKNHDTLERTGIIGLAVQGRYMFAFLPLVFIIGNYYLFKILKDRVLQLTYIAATLIIFTTASLPSYIVVTDANWYTNGTKDFNQKLHDSASRLYRSVL